MANIGFKLKEYFDSKGITQSEIAYRLGVSKAYVNSLFTGKREFGKQQAENWSNLFGLSVSWLLTGEGNMLKDESVNDHPIPGQTESTKRRIPFYDDISTVGGTNIVASDTPQMSPAEWIDAGDWFPEATAAIRHYGDSMIEYPSGSILALKRVEDHRLIIWGRNYSIETAEFRITKRLQDGGDTYILAYSSNMDKYPDGTLIHSPIKIPKETIRHIDLVLGCVTKEYSNGPIKIIK